MKNELLVQLLDSKLHTDQAAIVEQALIDILINERAETALVRIKDEVYREVEDMSKQDIINLLKEKLECHDE